MLGMLKDDLNRTASMIGWPATVYGFARTLLINAVVLALGIGVLINWNSANALARSFGVGIVAIQALRLGAFARELRRDAASN